MGGIVSRSPKIGDIDAVAREGRIPVAYIRYNKFPKGKNDCALRSGAIAISAILTLWHEGSKSCEKN